MRAAMNNQLMDAWETGHTLPLHHWKMLRNESVRSRLF